MEFTKDIYFNNSLKSGNIATITYSGHLFRIGSENVNLVFGYGAEWKETTTKPMNKMKNGFNVEVEIKDYDTFNFCFSNEHNSWDNNNYFNYISPILPKVVEKTAKETETIDDIIENILGNTVQNNIANTTVESVDQILDVIHKETLPEIEQLFTELFSAEFDHPVEKNSFIPEIAPNIPEKNSNEELIKLFNELFESSNDPISVNNISTEIPSSLNVSAFNLDGLVADLLEPIISTDVADTAQEQVSLFDDIINQEEDLFEEKALTVLDSQNLLVSSKKLGIIYKFKKKFKIAFYKLFVKIPKDFVKQLGF